MHYSNIIFGFGVELTYTSCYKMGSSQFKLLLFHFIAKSQVAKSGLNATNLTKEIENIS